MHKPPGSDDRSDEGLRELMAEYQDGRLEAFDRLYFALEQELRAFFGSRCRPAERVEDLLQDTFLQIHRSRRGYLRSLPVRPWVYAIAKRVFLMHVRTAHRREWPESTPLSDIPEPEAARTGDHLVSRIELTEAFSRLPIDGRRAFLLHHWRGLTFREIAARLHIEPGAVKVRSSRAASRLRRLLQRHPDESHD